MKLEFPLKMYVDDAFRRNNIESIKFSDFINSNNMAGEKLVKKGDIILIFNDSEPVIDTKEELMILEDKISAQNLVDIA